MGDSGAWNPMELLLTQWDVPVGVVLRDHRTRELEVGGGATASQGLRMFGKARFLRFGDAIWSEATVFHEIAAAHGGWQKGVLALVQGPEGASSGTVTGRDWDPARNEGN